MYEKGAHELPELIMQGKAPSIALPFNDNMNKLYSLGSHRRVSLGFFYFPGMCNKFGKSGFQLFIYKKK